MDVSVQLLQLLEEGVKRTVESTQEWGKPIRYFSFLSTIGSDERGIIAMLKTALVSSPCNVADNNFRCGL